MAAAAEPDMPPSTAAFEPWLHRRLERWCRPDARLPVAVARRLLERVAAVDRLGDALLDALDRPVATTRPSQLFDADDLDDGPVRWRDVDDGGSRLELIVRGPSPSPLEVDRLLSGPDRAEAVRLEVFASHLLPVYTVDVWLERRDAARGEWFSAPVSTRDPDVAPLLRGAHRVMRAEGWRRLSRRLCAAPVAGTGRDGRPLRVFECLFTTVYSNGRLTFGARGFETARRVVGNNRGADHQLDPAILARAMADVAVDWQRGLDEAGRPRQRRVSQKWPGCERVTFEADARGRIVRLTVAGREVWRRPA